MSTGTNKTKKRNIVAVNSYCSDLAKESVMVECISRFKEFGYDVLHVSGAPVRDKYQSLSDYYFHNAKGNVLLSSDKSAVIWYANNKISIHADPQRHGFACVSNFSMSAYIAEGLGYDNIIYTDFDNIISHKDLHALDSLVSYLDVYEAAFFTPADMFQHRDGTPQDWLETLVAAGRTSFLNKAKFPKTLKEWHQDPCFTRPNGTYVPAEEGVALKIKSFDGRGYPVKKINNTNIKHRIDSFFPNSRMDCCSRNEASIAYNKKSPHNPYFYIVIQKDSDYKVHINSRKSSPPYTEKKTSRSLSWVRAGQFFSTELDLREKEWDVKATKNGILIFDRTISVKNIQEYKHGPTVQLLNE